MKLGFAFLLAASCALMSCGYHTGLVAPEDRKTVGVEFFNDDGPLRDVEIQLQDELARAVQRMLPLRLVDPAHAELLVRGRVIDYSRRGGIRSPDDELLETGVIITVEATLVDPTRHFDKNGKPLPLKVLRKSRTTTQSGYRIVESDGERNARARALRNMADRLTLDLFGAVAYEPGDDPAQTKEPESY